MTPAHTVNGPGLRPQRLAHPLRTKVPEGAAHHTRVLRFVNTLCAGFFARLGLQPGGPTIVGEIAAAQQARCASCRSLNPPEPTLPGQNYACRPAARPRNRAGTPGRRP